MNTVRIVYRPDKSVAVIYPAPNSRHKGEKKDLWLKRVFERTMTGSDLAGLPFDDVDKSELPQTREHRNTWTGEKGKGITEK